MANEDKRKHEFVEAVIAGIHAHQIRLFRESGEGDKAAFAYAGEGSALDELAVTVTRLSRANKPSVLDWLARGAASRDEIPDVPPFTTVEACIRRLLGAHITLAPTLPVSKVTAYLKQQAPSAPDLSLRAVASLYQLVMQVSLDASELQDLFRLYTAINLPVSLEELGLDWDTPQFIAMGKKLAGACCACPFATSANDWHLASRKIKNWSERHRGKITAATYARELMDTPEVRECASALRGLPPQKFCIVGHSFTMSMHWASHGSFTDIAGHIVRHYNPGIEWVHLGRGNLTPTIARRDLLERVIQQRPDQTVLVTISSSEENRSDLRYVVRKLQDFGSKVITFDCVMVYPKIYAQELPASKIAREAGATVIEVYKQLDSHPDKDQFPALDGVHTAPPYHKFMAAELVRFLARRREAAQPVPKA